VDRPDGRRTRYAHRRGELLEAVTAHALQHGVADLTLRKVAASIGVSHATLVHHFETRDRLIGEIVDEVLTKALLPSPTGMTGGFTLASAWSYLRSEEGAAYTRLYLSLTGLALYGDPPFAEALRRSLHRRLEALTEGVLLLGCPPDEASAVATNVLARMRGLAIDLLLGDDDERLEAAFSDFQRDSERRRAEWSRGHG